MFLLTFYFLFAFFYTHWLFLYTRNLIITHKMISNMNNQKILLKIHKYGLFFHLFLFYWMLSQYEIHINQAAFWGFTINYFFIMYFTYVEGVAFGIKETLKEQQQNNKEVL